jgi:hypothetical protein
MGKLLVIITFVSAFAAASARAQQVDRAVLAFGSTGPNLTPF